MAQDSLGGYFNPPRLVNLIVKKIKSCNHFPKEVQDSILKELTKPIFIWNAEERQDSILMQYEKIQKACSLFQNDSLWIYYGINIAREWNLRGQEKKALHQLDECIVKAKKIDHLRFQYKALCIKAKTLKKTGGIYKAIQAYKKAIKIIESSRITKKENSKIVLSSNTFHEQYSGIIDCLFKKKQYRDAFIYWQAFKSKYFTDAFLTTKDLDSISISSLSLDHLQKKLQKKTIIIDYFIGKNYIYATVITFNEFKMIRLGSYDEFYIFSNNIIEEVKSISDKIRLGQFPLLNLHVFEHNLEQAYKFLLLQITELDFYSKKMDAWIIPNERLSLLPFEAFIHPTSNIYVLEEFQTIQYLLSLNTRLISLDTRQRPEYLKSLLIIEQLDYSGLYGYTKLKPLPKNLLQYEQEEYDYYCNEELTKNNLINLPFGSYNCVYLSSHGSLSSYQNDPYLNLVGGSSIELDDIGLMDFNSNIIILSACGTGVGGYIIGSGSSPHKMARKCLLSGAKSVIISLWDVDDEATNILMLELLNQLANGNSSTLALAKAKRKLRKVAGGKFDTPFYWSSFIEVKI